MQQRTRQAVEIACRQVRSTSNNTYRRLFRHEALCYRRDIPWLALWCDIDIGELERSQNAGPTATWRIIRALCRTLRRARRIRTIHRTYRHRSEIRALEKLILCELHLLDRQNSASKGKSTVRSVEIAA